MNNIYIRAARPFLKWAGGKTQLLEIIDKKLPEDMKANKIRRYVEPFVGGGAVFFYIVQHYLVEEFVIADINPELILINKTVKKDVEELLLALDKLSGNYLERNEKERELFFYEIRKDFNRELSETDFSEYQPMWVKRAAQIIFLNRTCFNGLFRVNAKGYFNVPFGRYKNPKICDAENLRAVSLVLQNTLILKGDFTQIEAYADSKTFVYFDPPYRPISQTAGFNSYAKDSFDDTEQLRLRNFYRELNKKGAKLMLSNSDPKNIDPGDSFFEDAYQEFRIEKVKASRIINSKAELRGPINELLIMNY